MIPVRLHLNEGASTTTWRYVRELDHGVLCRAFNLDPIRHSFDLPSTVRGDGRVGAGDNTRRGIVSGYLLRNGQPVGTIHVAREGERFRDLDPTNFADQQTLQQTR